MGVGGMQDLVRKSWCVGGGVYYVCKQFSIIPRATGSSWVTWDEGGLIYPRFRDKAMCIVSNSTSPPALIMALDVEDLLPHNLTISNSHLLISSTVIYLLPYPNDASA